MTYVIKCKDDDIEIISIRNVEVAYVIKNAEVFTLALLLADIAGFCNTEDLHVKRVDDKFRIRIRREHTVYLWADTVHRFLESTE